MLSLLSGIPPSPVAAPDPQSRQVLDAFFLGKALVEVVTERLGSVVGEVLSEVGRLQAEQQQQIRAFQVGACTCQPCTALHGAALWCAVSHSARPQHTARALHQGAPHSKPWLVCGAKNFSERRDGITSLHCAMLPCPALPCPALPCPALPCPADSGHDGQW